MVGGLGIEQHAEPGLVRKGPGDELDLLLRQFQLSKDDTRDVAARLRKTCDITASDRTKFATITTIGMARLERTTTGVQLRGRRR